MKPETTMRAHALSIFRAALEAADPERAVREHFHLHENFRRIFVMGAGKASAPMARALERILGDRIAAGSINTKYGHGLKLRRIATTECGHPVPDRNGVEGTRRLMEIARQAGEGDLIVCLISGGASALTPAPPRGVTLTDEQRVTKLLLGSGADIHELNTIRKHLSDFKGGQFARMAAPAKTMALILSDVTGDDLDVIGSGPTVPDRSTFSDASEILHRRGVWNKTPARVKARLKAGGAGKIPETPKPGDPVFDLVHNAIVGSNRLALAAAEEKAKSLGYFTLILSSVIEGETREAAGVHAAIAKEIVATGHPVPRPACVISGGETTVTLKGRGKGGRNLEFALAAAMGIAGLKNTAVLSCGTDGTDGPTDAAGAFATGQTIERAQALGLNAEKFLERNDSYRFFERGGGLIKTGPTRTNVMDVRVVLVGE